MQSEFVGKKLKLFDPAEALIRQQKEDEIKEVAIKLGYNQIYTPAICKRETLAKFGMVPPFETIVIKPENPTKADEARYEECKAYAYLMPKHANHVIIGSTFPTSIFSYKNLPIRLFELSDIYFKDDDELTNRAGVYFTALVAPEELEREIEILGAFYKSHYKIDSVFFVNKENQDVNPIAVCGHFYLDC